MKRLIFIVFLFPVLSSSAHAGLIIYNYGPGFVYDTVYDITWLMNANYVETTGYDDLLYGSDTGGRLTWYDAVEWVSNLSIYDAQNNIVFDNFRLPTFDGNYGYHEDGIGSEFAHLYYTELGNILDYIEGMEKQGPFINIVEQAYWSGVEHNENKEYAGIFTINWGDHTYNDKSDLRYVWPVMDGNIAEGIDLQHIPAPSAVILTGLGAVLVGWLRRQNTQERRQRKD